MGCPQNPRKFLGIRYNGPHNYVDKSVFGTLSSNAIYEVSRVCNLCGLNYGSVYRSEAKMQDLGYDIKKLQRISGWDPLRGMKNAKDLK